MGLLGNPELGAYPLLEAATCPGLLPAFLEGSVCSETPMSCLLPSVPPDCRGPPESRSCLGGTAHRRGQEWDKHP